MSKKQRNGEDLSKMTASRTALGWGPPDTWPEMFDANFTTWKKDHATIAENGEVQCVEYTDGKGEWLIVYDE